MDGSAPDVGCIVNKSRTLCDREVPRRTAVEQKLTHLDGFGIDGSVKRRKAVLILNVETTTCVDQKSTHIDTDSIVKRGVTRGILYVEATTLLDQKCAQLDGIRKYSIVKSLAAPILKVGTTAAVDEKCTQLDEALPESGVKRCPANTIQDVERMTPLDQQRAKWEIAVAASNVKRSFRAGDMHLGIEVQLTPTHVALRCRITKSTQVHITTLLSQDGRSPHSRRHRDCDNASLAKRAHRTPSGLQARLLSVQLRHGCRKRVPQCADASAPLVHLHRHIPTFPRMWVCLGKTCQVRTVVYHAPHKAASYRYRGDVQVAARFVIIPDVRTVCAACVRHVKACVEGLYSASAARGQIVPILCFHHDGGVRARVGVSVPLSCREIRRRRGTGLACNRSLTRMEGRRNKQGYAACLTAQGNSLTRSSTEKGEGGGGGRQCVLSGGHSALLKAQLV